MKFGARRLGTGATVWDGEVAGIEDGIRNCPRGPVWILSDSKAAIAAVVNAGQTGRASTGSLAIAVARMVYRVRRRGLGAVKLSWVKGHVGVAGKKEADKRAEWCTRRTKERSVTEGGVRAFWKEARSAERECVSYGLGRSMEWGRKVLTNYAHTRTGKGKIGHWRELVGQRDEGSRAGGGPRGRSWRAGRHGVGLN